MIWLTIALHLVRLTGPDGQVIEVNPEQIASIRAPRGVDHFAPAIRCNLFTSDGKNIGVMETCDKVRELLGSGP